MSTMSAPAIENRIRNANLLDVTELRRLLSATVHRVANYFEHGYLLVLERRDGTLQAACHVELERDRPTIDLLVVDPATRDTAVRQRMIGVASALCEAHGYHQPLAGAPLT